MTTLKRNGNILRKLSHREIRGRFPCGTDKRDPGVSGPYGRQLVHELSPAEAKNNIFIGFLSSGDLLVSCQYEFSRDLDPYEPYEEPEEVNDRIIFRFWSVAVADGKLSIAPFWEFNVNSDRCTGTVQQNARILFYEFPHDNRYQVYFVWDLEDTKGRCNWLVKAYAGVTPSVHCAQCRTRTDQPISMRACDWHRQCVTTVFHVKNDRYIDIRKCICPLSANRLLVLRPHKGLVNILNFSFLPSTLNHILISPSFDVSPKLQYNGCTEGLCKGCYDSWTQSYWQRSQHQGIPSSAYCHLSKRQSAAVVREANPLSELSVDELDKLKAASAESSNNEDTGTLFHAIQRMKSTSVDESSEIDPEVRDVLRKISSTNKFIRSQLLTFCSEQVIKNYNIGDNCKWTKFLDELTNFSVYKGSLVNICRSNQDMARHASDLRRSNPTMDDDQAVVPFTKEKDPIPLHLCTACELGRRLAGNPKDLSLLVIRYGVLDNHEPTCRENCVDSLSVHDIDGFSHWMERQCRFTSEGADKAVFSRLAPQFLSQTGCQRSICSSMPWLLMNEERCISYSSELLTQCADDANDSQQTDCEDEFAFFDIPLLSNNAHLAHDSSNTKFATSRSPLGLHHAACRVEELMLALRILLHRQHGIPVFGPVPTFCLECVTKDSVELRVTTRRHGGEDISVLFDLETGKTRSWTVEARANVDSRLRTGVETAVDSLDGSNAVFYPDIRARVISFYPPSLDHIESLNELVDDSGMFCIRKVD